MCPLKRNDFTEKEIKEIIKRYRNMESLTSLRKSFRCRGSKIRKIIEENGIHIRSSNEALTSEQLATNKKYSVNEMYFEKIDSYDKAYWLGFLFADGYIIDSAGHNSGKRKGLTIGISLKEEDGYHIENFKHAINSSHPITRRIIKLNGKEFPATRFEIGNVKMGEDLISHGCTPRKSLTLEYPKGVKEKYFPAFLHGYFDGDGCVFLSSDKKSYSVSIVGTFSFLNSIKQRLLKYRIKTSMVKNDGSKAFSVTIHKSGFLKFFNLLYKKSKDSYLLDRKYDKFVKIAKVKKDIELIRSNVSELSKSIF